jgi:hypothetical protein
MISARHATVGVGFHLQRRCLKSRQRSGGLHDAKATECPTPSDSSKEIIAMPERRRLGTPFALFPFDQIA